MVETIVSKRHGAGANPVMRQRILDGAAGVFLERGFDAASMNDICRAAGVSKSTLYVYFAHKEDLFEALIDQKRDLMFGAVAETLFNEDPQTALTGFLLRLVGIVCSPDVIRAQRTIIGIVERMPDLGARFYAGGAERAQNLLCAYLERQVASGHFAIPDTNRAAYQLIELATAGLQRQCLYCVRCTAPSEDEMRAAVDSALTVFRAAYWIAEKR